MNLKTITVVAGLATAAATGWMVTGCQTATATADEPVKTLRAPAYPLVTIDPYTSAWSASDNLNDDVVRHWTGKPFPLIGAVKIDGKIYRFMGMEQPELSMLSPTAKAEAWDGFYTTEEPKGEWNHAGGSPCPYKVEYS